MSQQTETRLLNEGLDTVTAPFQIKDGAFLNAVNLRTIAAQSGQQAGYANFIQGNEPVTAVGAIIENDSALIGKWAAPERDSLYLFFYSPTRNTIVEYNNITDTARVVIDDTKVTGGLGFTADMFICARVGSDLLMWANAVTDARYLDLRVDYMSGAPISLGQLSLITEPPVVPLIPARDNLAGSTSTIQTRNVQFTYRFWNQSGLYSVLAPYSLTSFATREAAISANADAGNAIDITVPLAQKVPSDWKYVDLVARFPDTAEQGFFLIKRWDAGDATDAAEVAAHNAGTTALELQDWTGTTIEALDDAYTSKQFDLAPLVANTLELAANRLVLGGIKEGYDHVNVQISLAVTPHTFNVLAPSPNPARVWVVFVKEYNVDKQHFAMVVRYQGVNYLLPPESSVGYFESGSLPRPDINPINAALNIHAPIFSLPSHMHASAFIRLQEQGDFVDATGGNAATGSVGPANFATNVGTARAARQAIVVEANGLGGTGFRSQWDGDGVAFDHWLVPYADIIVDDDAGAVGTGGETRAFVSGATYNLGVQFYDASLRRPGRNDVTSVTIAPKTSLEGPFTDRLTITPSLTGGVIPDWAVYYGIVMSKNQLTNRVIEFVTGLVKLAITENSQTVFRGLDEYPIYPVSAIKGIAFPITSLASANYGYDYQQGDVIEYAFVDGASVYQSGALQIRSVESGYIIAYDDSTQHTNIASMLAERFKQLHLYNSGTSSWKSTITFTDLPAGALRPKIVCRILSRNQSDQGYYEVAAIGEIDTSGPAPTFGGFYPSGAASVDIYGDMHLQTRTGISGSATVESIAPNEQNTTFWITDSGRTTPTDTIGQQRLPGSIRWSNVHIPGAATNGYASFDALDIKFADETAGAITALMLTTRGAQDGGQLLVLCERGSFVALVGQQQLSDQSGSTGLTVAANVFGDLNPIKGDYGCSSPRSVSRWQHRVWWVDTYRREVIEFGDGGANSIAGFGMNRAFREMLGRAAGIPVEAHGISTGVNPYTREMMLSIPASAPPDPVYLNTTTLPAPFDASVNQPATFLYAYEPNRWQARFDSGAEFMNLADAIFSWKDNNLWREFIGPDGSYYGFDQPAVVAIPFSMGYPAIKTPQALRVVAERAPSQAWVMCNDDGKQRVAGLGKWEYKEGTYRAAIRRERKGANSTDWALTGINGATLKGRVVFVVLVWEPDSAPINASSVAVEWSASFGQGKPNG